MLRCEPSVAMERQDWPEGAADLAEQLHRHLAIGDRDWHALKSQRPRRAAEQIAAALVQLVREARPDGTTDDPARDQAIDLLEHGLAWLKKEIRDPGCPSHGR